MDSLFGTAVDLQNIGLAKVLCDVRQDLDVHCLLSVNWSGIKECGLGESLFLQIRRRTLGGIVLGLCKIYEEEKQYQLNSIDGILRTLQKQGAKIANETVVKAFIESYSGSSTVCFSVDGLQSTVEGFKKQYTKELTKFKEARDKVIAHSEFFALVETVPSFEVMEKLFFFGVDFYVVIHKGFIGGNADNLRSIRPVKANLEKVLRRLGLPDVKLEWE